MRKEDLYNFHISQMDILKENKEKLRVKGCVTEYKDVYPDIHHILKDQDGIAYIRGDVSLKLMTILYDKIIIYIPPLSKESLIKRFNLNSWDDLLSLCRHGIVIPIIGKSEDYNASHFNSLFQLPIKPCSLWARGLALLDIFGMSDTLYIAKEVMPVNDIANDSIVFNKMKKLYRKYGDDEYIKKKIIDDVSVQYADLKIFGCQNYVDSILSLSTHEIYNKLKMLNEIITYPVLFGMESQANFDLNKLKEVSKVNIKSKIFPISIPEQELSILYEGIGINIEDISINDIIAYHDDGLGKRLRKALSEFNSYCDNKLAHNEQIEISQVYGRAERFQRELDSAISDLNEYHRLSEVELTNKRINNYLKIGTVALGSAITYADQFNSPLSLVSLLGTGLAIIEQLPDELSELLTRLSVRAPNKKFVSNMWLSKKIVKGEK